MENGDFKQRYIINNFIVPWLNNGSALTIGELESQECLEEFYNGLLFPLLSKSESLLRSFIDYVFLNVPSTLRLRITGIIKRLRNPHQALKIRYPLDAGFNQHILHLKKESGADFAFWKGKRAAMCLSHDVDTLGGYRFLPTLMRSDHDYRIPSVFNVLTHGDYRLDKALVSELLSEGFEIGLHGYRHELGMARKPYARLKTEFEYALDLLASLGVEVQGFRAPGFSISSPVLSVLDDLKFTYDSSMQLCNGLYHSCGVSFPYKYPGKNFWEIPLSVQDDLFFRDARIEEKEVLQILEKIILQTIELGGMAFFNLHPCLMKERVPFYKMFLELLNKYREEFWFVQPGKLCYWLDKNIERKAI